jgi:hypothetical protein
LWLSDGICSYICVYINAVANSDVLYFQYYLYNVIFKIKLYIASGSSPPSPQGKILGADLFSLFPLFFFWEKVEPTAIITSTQLSMLTTVNEWEQQTWKDDSSDCWISSSDFYGYHADFHEGHGVAGEQHRVCELARHEHGKGVAWVGHGRHGYGMVCVHQP